MAFPVLYFLLKSKTEWHSLQSIADVKLRLISANPSPLFLHTDRYSRALSLIVKALEQPSCFFRAENAARFAPTIYKCTIPAVLHWLKKTVVDLKPNEMSQLSLVELDLTDMFTLTKVYPALRALQMACRTIGWHTHNRGSLNFAISKLHRSMDRFGKGTQATHHTLTFQSVMQFLKATIEMDTSVLFDGTVWNQFSSLPMGVWSSAQLADLRYWNRERRFRRMRNPPLPVKLERMCRFRDNLFILLTDSLNSPSTDTLVRWASKAYQIPFKCEQEGHLLNVLGYMVDLRRGRIISAQKFCAGSLVLHFRTPTAWVGPNYVRTVLLGTHGRIKEVSRCVHDWMTSLVFVAAELIANAFAAHMVVRVLIKVAHRVCHTAQLTLGVRDLLLFVAREPRIVPPECLQEFIVCITDRLQGETATQRMSAEISPRHRRPHGPFCACGVYRDELGGCVGSTVMP